MTKNTSKGKVPPGRGGCWFCHKDDGELVFEDQFDTFVHVSCIIKALEVDPNDPEAQLMTDVFSPKDGGWVSIKEYERNRNKDRD